MPAPRFPRDARVRAGSDFDRIFKHGRRVALPVLALHWQAADRDTPGAAAGARLGLAVSRKVDPRAVGRNRIKRVLRDAFRHRRHRLAPGDYVLVARPPARGCSSEQLRAALDGLFVRAGVIAPSLPLPGAPGTMPPPRQIPAPALPSDPTPPDRGG